MPGDTIVRNELQETEERYAYQVHHSRLAFNTMNEYRRGVLFRLTSLKKQNQNSSVQFTTRISSHIFACIFIISHHSFAILIPFKQGLVGAPACGDVMKLQIKVDDDGNIIESKFKTFGCGSAIASSSLATEWVKGRTLDEVLAIKNSDIASHLKLPPVKLHCSMLAEDAIRAAVADLKAKQDKNKQQAA